jgi:acyl carrier protein
MHKPKIYNQINRIFRDLFDDDGIALTPLTSSGDIEGWNSLAHINLIVAVEEKFKIRFKTAEIESLRTNEQFS